MVKSQIHLKPNSPPIQSGYNTANALVILEDLIPSTSSAKVDYLVSRTSSL